MLAEDVETVGYFPHALRRRPIANILTLFATIREIWRADMVVFGGGGLIYDNEPGQSYAKLRAEWLLRVWLARLLRRPIYWCAVGVYVSPERARALRALFAGPGIRVSVRDTASLATLASIGVAATLVPDPVHLYEPAPHAEASDGAPRLVGLALRSGYARDDATLVRGLVLGLRARGYEPVFASHSLHGSDPAADDLASCLAVA